MENNMFKKGILTICAIIITSSLTGCECRHEWTAATCTAPKMCTKCGLTEGEALGHDWIDADCVSPKTCSRCGTTIGKSLGHDWKEADCNNPKTCRRCGVTEGDPLQHNWEEANCVAPKTCTYCGLTEGECLGHDVAEWVVTQQPTCSQEGIQSGTCSRCGEEVERPLEKLPHTESDWKIVKKATSSEHGVRQRVCTVCGEVLYEGVYVLEPEDKKDAFKKECKEYDYNTIARNPQEYFNDKGKISGKALQVVESGMDTVIRVGVNGSYTNVIWVEYQRPASADRVLENDWITVYGIWKGTNTYTSTTGVQITLPKISAEYIDIA